jgi:hypothetical protein
MLDMQAIKQVSENAQGRRRDPSSETSSRSPLNKRSAQCAPRQIQRSHQPTTIPHSPLTFDEPRPALKMND